MSLHHGSCIYYRHRFPIACISDYRQTQFATWACARMQAGVSQRQKQRGVLLGQFPRALSEERGGETPDRTDCPGHAKHILLRNLVGMAVFVLFCGWVKFSKSCAFGAGAFGAGLAALARKRSRGTRHTILPPISLELASLTKGMTGGTSIFLFNLLICSSLVKP